MKGGQKDHSDGLWGTSEALVKHHSRARPSGIRLTSLAACEEAGIRTMQSNDERRQEAPCIGRSGFCGGEQFGVPSNRNALGKR